MIYVDEMIKNTYRVPQPEGRGAYIRLDQNENPDGVPQWLFDSVMEKVTPAFLAIYPEETIPTEKYAHLLGLEKENVTLTAGSSVGMGYVIKTFGEPGKNIITVTPSFAMYEVYAEMIGMKVVNMQYESDFSYKVENTLAAINEDTSIVVLVNPNMPVGNVYAKEDIKAIVEKAKEFNALVIIDEAYYYFYDKTTVALVKEYDNVVVLRTFSKMLSIPMNLSRLRSPACLWADALLRRRMSSDVLSLRLRTDALSDISILTSAMMIHPRPWSLP